MGKIWYNIGVVRRTIIHIYKRGSLMKHSKRFKQLQSELQEVSDDLNHSIKESTGGDEVNICNVTITRAEALHMQQIISKIMSADTPIDLEENFIPIQLIMVDDSWRKIQSDINELKN